MHGSAHPLADRPESPQRSVIELIEQVKRLSTPQRVSKLISELLPLFSWEESVARLKEALERGLALRLQAGADEAQARQQHCERLIELKNIGCQLQRVANKPEKEESRGLKLNPGGLDWRRWKEEYDEYQDYQKQQRMAMMEHEMRYRMQAGELQVRVHDGFATNIVAVN